MQNQNEIIQKLKALLPKIKFKADDTSRWSYSEQTVYYENNGEKDIAGLLHEAGHAALGHHSYHLDIDLLEKERQAWEKAEKLLEILDIRIPKFNQSRETALESYRLWLSTRSLCPKCKLAGLQSSKDLSYFCTNCDTNWEVPISREKHTRRQLKNKKV